jgi:hypothetical protein
VNDFAKMHCLAKANNHIVSAVNDFCDLDFPSLHGVDFTDVAIELFTAIGSKYPSFVPTFEAPNNVHDVDVLAMLANTIANFSDACEDQHPLVSALRYARKDLVLTAPASYHHLDDSNAFV